MGQSYSDLVVWQKAMALVTEIYRLTAEFPARELYGLADQMRRAAVSVPSNIAEGQGRLSHKDFRLFLGHARGSLLELATQIQIAMNVQYLTRENGNRVLEQSTEVGRILNGLIAAMTAATTHDPKAA
ncbi:MAG TPA: four helix bundle protein [Terriglobales bacterium]|jgi:four helix bundle protein